MLKHIQIKDFAIIDAVELEFDAGMTALTGETGAGKSILVDALLFVAGGRAGAELLRHGAERAEVSAIFAIGANPAARRWCEEQSIEQEDECQLRRVLGADGRSRAYVNGQAMPVQALKQLGELLIDVHGQMEFQSLVRRPAQRDIVDKHGAHPTALQHVAVSWSKLKQKREEHAAAVAGIADRGERIALLRYHIGELEGLAAKPGEAVELNAERQRLAHSNRLAQGAQEITELLVEAESGTTEQLLSRALSVARSLSGVDAKLNVTAGMLEEALIATREAASAIQHYAAELEADPARQEWVEQRLAALETAARKHRVGVDRLDSLLTDLRAELARLESLEFAIETLVAKVRAAQDEYTGDCARLTDARRLAATSLSERISGLMQGLGMPGGRFEVEVRPLPPEAAGESGADEIEFMVSANPGQPLRPLARVASGGELSRISLAIQVAAVESLPCPCLVFDEVDAGVGGGVAEMVGRQLRELAARAQVLCVTHLPQVASQAHSQVRVSKLSDGRHTRTRLETLNASARQEEIARMLGGAQISDMARAHAAEMLDAAAQGDKKPGRVRRK